MVGKHLKGDDIYLMRGDGMHSNEIGHDIFLSGIQGIKKALFFWGGGS